MSYPVQYGPQAPPTQAIIEVDGKLRFDLPGVSMFPALTGDTVLKVSLEWAIQADAAGKLDAELAYVSGGFRREGDYNVTQGAGKTVDLTGWVTIENRSGKAFENARVNLMAGSHATSGPGATTRTDKKPIQGALSTPNGNVLFSAK